MERLSRSWALLGASWQVLLTDPALLIFPILGMVTAALAGVVIAAPLWLFVGVEQTARNTRRDGYSPETLAVLFVFYLVTAFCTLFFNSALAAVVLGRLRGERTTLGQGFAAAGAHLPGILGYAVISATVGVLLRTLENRGGVVGQIIIGLLGTAWSVLTFLVVPVMVAENIDPFSAIRRSTALLKQTWGEQIVGNLGVGVVIFLLALPAGLVLAVAVLVHLPTLLLVGLGVLAILYWLVLGVLGSALGQVYRAAVYLYAATGQVPAGFAPWMLQNAFRAR